VAAVAVAVIVWEAWAAEALPCVAESLDADSVAESLDAGPVPGSVVADSAVATGGTATNQAFAFGPISGGHGAPTKPILVSYSGAAIAALFLVRMRLGERKT
jgi:hypothetical protein